ncbi:MAG: 6-bladed beta-propeller, partial [Actinomycetota bacterium]
DSEGHLYVADGIMSTVQIFDEEERFLLYFGERGGDPGEFYLPGGVFIDADDRIYVADTYNSRVQVFQYLKEGQP